MKKMNFEGILAELKALPNWVGFKVWRDARSGKWQKRPVDIKASEAAQAKDKNAKAILASSTKRETWTDFESARRAVEGRKFGISCLGFAFDGGGIVGIDLDHCVGENGSFSDFAKEVLESVPGYAEYSPSGTGVHILARCEKAFSGGGINRPEIEIYRSGRFFTVTGNKLSESSCEVLDCTDAVVSLYERYGGACEGVVRAVSRSLGEVGFVSDPQNNAVVGQPLATVGEADILNEVSGRSKTVADLSDDELLDKARNAKGGVKFEALWRGDFSGYKSQSEADLALCNSLAFWTADDAARMDRLFCASGLYRQKWQEKHGSTTYGQKTIEQVLSRPHDVYKPPQPKSDNGSDKPKRKRKPAFTAAESIVEENGELYLISQNGNKKRLTNFTVKVECELATDDESIYSFVLKNVEKEERLQFKTLDMVSSQAFKKKLNEKSMGWLFWATDRELELIKEYLNAMPRIKKRGYKGIGMLKAPTEDKPLRYVYAGERFSIDERGAEVGDVVSIATERRIRAIPEDNDSMTQGEFIQIGRLLTAYNETPKSVSVLCFMAACFAKPKLNARGVKFPHLVIVGEAGSGKSFTIDNVIKPFFSATKSYQVSEMTQFTLLKALSSSNCIPLFLDEYKPSTINDRQINNLHNSLRGAYDGLEGERGTADQGCKTYELTAPIVLIGEESPREPAVKERSIELLFSKMDIENRKAFGEAIESANSKYAIKNLGREVLLEALKASESDLRTAYTNALCVIDKRIPPRSAGCIAAVIVGQDLLERVALRYGTDYKTVFGLSREETIGEITEAVKKWTLGGNHNKSVVDKAFETFNRMGEVLRCDLHYGRKDVERGGKTVKGIAFDIRRIYDKFTKYVKDCALKQEVLDADTFCSQLEKKDYFMEKNRSAWLLKDGEFGAGGKHTVKCYLLDATRLAAKCDVETILENCGITLDAHTELTEVQEELPF
jgi:hypothetical protein